LAAATALCVGASVFLFAPAQAQNTIPFVYDVIDYSPPLQSHCKAVGDIDGDGFPDALVASAQAGYGFYWYRYPDWNKYTIVPPGTGFTTDMQVGDVDGDGDLDAIIPKGWDKGQSVFWYENPRPSGDPATDTWIEHSIGAAPAHDVEVGDINNDGKLDVVVRDGRTTVFIQNTPTSWTRNEISTRPIEGTALGDIDNDGDLDIAINGYWLENPLPGGNPATSGWNEYTITTSWPTYSGSLITDLNGDGRADVVLSPSEGTGRFSWFEGPASPRGGSWTEHSIDTSAEYMHTFEAADMDLDGDLDLITSEMLQSQNPDEVSVYINEGGASSWTHQVVATTGSHNLRVADIGSDGDMDIVGINWQGTTPFEVWHNQLNPSYSLDQWDRHVIDSNKPWRAVFVDAGDLNGDALPDIVTGGWWYRNPGTAGGSWTRNDLGSPLNNMAAVYDFDGDGQLDVLGTEGVGSDNNANFVWARNNGQGSFSILQNIQSGNGDFLQGVAVDQLQNGGPLEVVLSWHAGTGGVQRLTVPSDPVNQTWAWSQLSSTSQEEQVSAGDIDRDGDTDLLLGTVWLRNDGASWSAHTVSNTSSIPDRSRLADVNGDGRLDAVVGFEFESKLAWYEQGASPTSLWTEHPIATDFFAPMSLDVGDLDRDGDVDVVAGEHNLSNPTSARLHVFENTGGGSSWTSHNVHTGDEHHDGTQLVDIDNDGDLDIISIGWSHGRVLLYENKSNTGGPPSNRAPVARFQANPSSGSAPLTVSFDASLSFDPDGDVLTYAWAFGDGSTATGPTPTHIFAENGAYSVGLTVSDGQLNGTASTTVLVQDPPDTSEGLKSHWPLDETSGTVAADAIGPNTGTLRNGPVWQPTGGRVGGALRFDGVNDVVDLGPVDVLGGSGLTIAMWVWIDGFGTPDARFISKATGVQDDDHYWMLSTINDTGLRFRLKLGSTTRVLMTGSNQVSVGQWVHIAATYDGSQMRIYNDGVEVASQAATGQIATNPGVMAALGNQPAGTSSRPLDGMLDDVRIYNYALTGSEIAQLMGPNSNEPPTASFTATATSGTPPLSVSFDASASSDPDGDPLSYQWDFGDGGTASGVTTSHTFNQAGVFTVTLTVGDGTVTRSVTKIITVSNQPPPNSQPIATFSSNRSSGEAPLEVDFDASASFDPDGDPLTYSWDFGDGSTATGVMTNHTFAQIGAFTVTLTVDDGALTATATTVITVSDEPDPAPTLTLGLLQNPVLTQFVDIFLVASEPLDPNSISVNIGNDVIAMSLLNAAANVWKGDYELTKGGALTIDACAADFGGTSSCTSMKLQAGLVLVSGGAVVPSHDNTFSIRIPEGHISNNGFILVVPSGAALQDGESPDRILAQNSAVATESLPAFDVSPRTLMTSGIATIEFHYERITLPAGIELSQLYVHQEGVGALESRIDKRYGVIHATARELGEFSLKVGSPGMSVDADYGFARLHQNFPNPFNPSTTIEFEVQTRQHVQVAVYDVSGRLLAVLVDQQVAAGIGRVTWNGKSDRGEILGSGVYFVRLKTVGTSDTRKILLVK